MIAHFTRIRIAGKKIRKYIHRYILRFRNLRKIRFEAQIQKVIKNFSRMHKIVQASQIIIKKIILIQKTWKKF
jgi:hypothetical protein